VPAGACLLSRAGAGVKSVDRIELIQVVGGVSSAPLLVDHVRTEQKNTVAFSFLDADLCMHACIQQSRTCAGALVRSHSFSPLALLLRFILVLEYYSLCFKI
jgi:hypothetical protein